MTLIIIIITSLFSIIGFQGSDMMYRFQFNAYSVKHNKEWIRFFSHALLHADWVHLLMNMLVLYFFGDLVEMYFEYYFGTKGMLYFGLLYVGGIIFAVLPSYKKHQDDVWYNSVGASGAVSAVLFSSVILDPLNSICLYGILCLPGVVWAIIYLAYSFYMSKKATDNINHDAHLWGAIFGIVFTIVIKPALGLLFIERIINIF